MHREIEIKQFPILTTHWWPKTRNERFVWENEQYLYRFLPLVHNHVQVIWVRTRIRCVTCVCARSGNEWRIRARDHFRRLRRLTPHSHGASASTPLVDFEWSDVKRCRTELWVRRVASLALLAAEVENFSTFQAPTEASANQIASCKYPIPFMQHQRSMWLIVVTMMVCLRPSMCSYDGELFNLDFSVHVLFPSYRDSDLYLPLYDWQTRTVWPKNIKIGSTEEKKTPTSWMPLG